jgi:hypothetical protein
MGMKVTVNQPVEVEITSVRVEVSVRYGVDDIPNDFPLRDGAMWRGTIEIETGKILEWPADKPEHHCLNMNVCDQGIYTLLGPDGTEEAKIDGYCPNRLIPGEYGDHIDLEIGGGVVTNWPKRIDLLDFFLESDEDRPPRAARKAGPLRWGRRGSNAGRQNGGGG